MANQIEQINFNSYVTSSLQFVGAQITVHINDEKYYDDHMHRIILDERNPTTLTGSLSTGGTYPYYSNIKLI